MSFTCTVGQLVTKLYAKLALADQVSLTDLWGVVSEYTDTPEVDGFQKNVVWRALMANTGVPLLQVFARNEPVEVSPDLPFGAVLSRAPESEVYLRPTEDCQFRYLTDTDDFVALKTQLGELPFALLIVIARHGKNGILNADLARESGQDIRSLRLRLQKLEAASLVVSKNVYVDKKHTTHTVHFKFAPEPVRSKDVADEEQDIEVTRDIKRLRSLIINALKIAPNQLRGFSDLQKELNLSGSRSAAKFFRAVCLRMHRQGHIEKLHVELPETKQLVYALKYLKDVTSDAEETQDLTGVDPNERDGFDDSDLDDEVPGNTPALPVWNKIFPSFHQIYAQIENSGSQGITGGEICKNIFGSSDYRPYSRLFEVLPTYLSNSKNLKAFKKYAEPYDDHSVSKLYENEGKLKFYKYFATRFCTEDKPAPKPYNLVPKASKSTLTQLQSRYSTPIKTKGRSAEEAWNRTKEQLWEKKRRFFEYNNGASPSPVAAKKPKLAKKKQKQKEWIAEDDDEIPDDIADTLADTLTDDLSAIDVALAAQDRSSRRRKAAPQSFAMLDDNGEVERDSGDEYTPKAESEEEDFGIPDEDIEAVLGSSETHRLSETPTLPEAFMRLPSEGPSKIPSETFSEVSPEVSSIIPSEVSSETPLRLPTISAISRPMRGSTPRPERKRVYPVRVKAEGSLKSVIRQDHLLAIIREDGGAAFKTVALCRRIDERLASKTSTDSKTLGRDIEYLVGTGVLRTENVVIETDDKQHETSMIILADPAERPSLEQIERIKKDHAGRSSRKNMAMFAGRVIQSDIKLYVETRREKPRKPRKGGRGRLAALGEDENTETPSPNGDEVAANDPSLDMGVLTRIKSKKRPRKAVPTAAPTFGPKRPRRSIKLEKTDSTTLYRCVVISKAFSRDAIDFDAIAQLLGHMAGHVLKQKWGTLRRSFGGASAVSKGVETFQNMVMQGIEDGVVSEQDLLDASLEFFLDFWRKFDTSTEFAVADEMPLYASFDTNASAYNFAPVNADTSVGLLEKTDDLSMRQKEFTLSQTHFSWERNMFPSAQPLDKEKSVLKSIFATGEDNFDRQIVDTVLGKFDDKDIRKATDALTSSREASFLSFGDAEKFVVGERFKSALVPKPLSAKLLRQAAAFKETLADISAAEKGLFVSQAIQPGEVAALLELVSAGLVDITRVDRHFRFESYESRLVDKDQIACDIIVQVDHEKVREIETVPVGAPLKGPCEPLWVDVGANFNKDLWTKIIVAIISYVVFRPGTTDYLVHERMSAVLTFADYCSAMGWLVNTGCIERTSFGGYIATNRWQYILGF